MPKCHLFFLLYSFFLLCNGSDDNLKKESDMEGDLQRALSLRLNRRGDRSNQSPAKGEEGFLKTVLVLLSVEKSLFSLFLFQMI